MQILNTAWSLDSVVSADLLARNVKNANNKNQVLVIQFKND